MRAKFTKRKIKIFIAIILVFVLAGSIFLNFSKFSFLADEIQTTVPEILLPVNNDREVYSDTPLIQGIATPNSSLDILIDDIAIGDAITSEDGRWFYKPNPISNGTHTIVAKEKGTAQASTKIYISVDLSTPDSAILKAQNTQIIENNHPYYANGANQYDAIVKMMGNPNQVENDFAAAEQSGVKMLRIINYTLDDMALPNPTSAPTVTVENGGGIVQGDYIYRYTCANLSAETFSYNTAETLPSPITNIISVNENDKVTLKLSPCAKSYRYLIYRRSANDPIDSEEYLGFAEAPAGTEAIFIDNGSLRPSNGVWQKPTTPLIATAEINSDPNTAGKLAADDYIYSYIVKQARKPINGIWEKFVDGGYVTSDQEAEVTVATNQKVKLEISSKNLGSWISIYRRKKSDPDGNETLLFKRSIQAGTTTIYDDGSTNISASRIPTDNTTTKVGLPTSNNTRNNPRSSWPTSQSSAFMTGMGNWNEDALVAADKVMVLAKKYNIRILFTFLDQHDNNTGGVREIARNCGTWNSNFFADTCSIDTTKEIVTKFADRTNTVSGIPYKDDPAIFSWELINEPWETNSGGGFRTWVNNIGSFIKNKDSNHMLSSGDDGSIWLTHNAEAAYNFNNNHDFVMDANISVVDLLTWHGYPESSGFMFNHGYYGEFDPSKDPVKYADWLDKYGPVSGPITKDQAVKQLNLHQHYASLLNKPVVFGEWGVNWSKSDSSDWVSQLSDAILNQKPDLVRGENAWIDTTFNQDLNTTWDTSTPYHADISVDSSKQYNGHGTLKISTKMILDSAQKNQYYGTVTSQKISVKPNASYWFDFTAQNPTSTNLSISLGSYYKNGQKIDDFGWGNSGSFSNSTSFVTTNRFNSGLCEFTMPDADQVTIKLSYSSTNEGDSAWIGEIKLSELVAPSTQRETTFATTGWWGVPTTGTDATSDKVVATLRDSAVNFAKASFENLPSLSGTSNHVHDQSILTFRKNYTYKSEIVLSGTIPTYTKRLLVNNIEAGVNISGNTWNKSFPLSIGQNQIKISTLDGNDEEIITNLTITRRKSADANNDGKIDVKDFSSLMINWNKIDNSNPADFNEDASVNIKDFSILMVNWGK